MSSRAAAGESFDIAVVGAGVVGSCAALALSELPLRVVLIEARAAAASVAASGFDPRVMALNAHAQSLLQRLGVWASVSSARRTSYHSMRVWDGDGSGAIAFSAAAAGCAELGAIVEQHALLEALQQRLQQREVTQLQPATVVQERRRDGAMVLQLDDGSQLSATLVVAADGAQSPLRQRLGFATRSWSYGQDAIITTLRTSLRHGATAYQRFTEHGPLALLPLGGADGDGHHCSLVWSQSSVEAARLMALDDGDFCRQLTLASESVLGSIEGCDQRYCVPLAQRHAVDYVQANVALIGDAAHAIHPLAGQGVNLGLKDVAALTAVVAAALEVEGGAALLGDSALLRRYQRRRQPDNLATMAAMEGLKRLFGSRSPLLRVLRNSGLNLFDNQAQLKRWVVAAANGGVA